jgi:hypothetical protein
VGAFLQYWAIFISKKLKTAALSKNPAGSDGNQFLSNRAVALLHNQ